MGNKKLRDHLSFKETIRQLKSVFLDYLLLIKEWITDYGKVILPIILLACVTVTTIVALSTRERVEAATAQALEVLEDTKDKVGEVPQTAFEENAYPAVNLLVNNYFDALANADLDALISLENTLTDTEILRLQEMGKYIDHYDNVTVYTKPGPYADTYIAYVYTEVVLTEQEVSTPGLQAFYICCDENGNFYINGGDLTDSEADYIKAISEQADVIDLKNTVSVQYSNLMEENKSLGEYWANISVKIDLAVGNQLAQEAAIQAQKEADEKAAHEALNTQDEVTVPVIQRIKTNTTLNVRKSASESAEKLGKAPEGTIYEVIEQLQNGWTKINYEGQEAFLKTEYLTNVEDTSNIATNGTVTATTTLNVRAEANQTSQKIGVINQGDSVELIENINGWCKIKYDGQVAYVKSDYVR